MRLSALVLVLMLSGCAGLDGDVRCRDQLIERLYLGMAIPAGGVVSEEEFQRFVDAEITPRFTAGFTVYAANGQWRGRDQIVVREPTRVVEVIHAGSSAEEAKLGEIAASYKTRFKQEAVLRVRSVARACL